MEEKRRSKRSKTIDEGYWDCTVCTYKNSPEAFKCEMCDVRKGTSTRKPRLNAQLVAQQVAQQYAPPPKKEKSSTDPGSDGGEVLPPSINTRERENTTRERTSGGGGTFEKPEKEKKRHSHLNHTSTKKEKNNNSATTSSTPTTNSNKKLRPPRLKNIDRSSFTTMEVTVGSVTVIITDYKPKNKERRTSSDNQLSNTNSDSGESSLSHLSSTDIKKDLSDVEMAEEAAC